MILPRLSPVLLSSVLAAAHFLRSGNSLLSGLALLLPALLLVRKAWAVRVVQIGLILASLEWLRTLTRLVILRVETGEPWSRMALILAAVALFTAASIFVFRFEELRRHFELRR